MSNQTQLEMLKQKLNIGDQVNAWNQWRISNRHIRPDLSDADLRDTMLHDANLSETDFRGAILSGANLSRANLIGANLSGANLSGANLSRANLSRAILCNTTCHRADISRARLSEANLTEADLMKVNLKGANLRGANLSRAKLRETDLSEAKTEQTLFANVDLSTVNGLETVEHTGPSMISVDTLYRSGNNIPEIFLRGVGLPEAFITYLHSLMGRAIEFYSCFISYSHADKSFARRLHDALQGRGIRCWLDEHQILPGNKIYTEVDRGIRLWDKVLLCCSKDSLGSWWVDNEIKIAFDKEQDLWRERGKEVLALIPLNLDGYLFTGQWRSGLATEVKARLAADFTGWEQANHKFEEQIEYLVRALRTDDGGKELPPRPKL